MNTRIGISLLVSAALVGAFAQGTSDKKPQEKKPTVATSPFIQKAGADKVKDVRDKAEARKADEKLLDPTKGPVTKESQASGPLPAAGGQPATVAPGQGEPSKPPPPPKPTWRLKGIAYGKKGSGVAVFDIGKENALFIKPGQSLDEMTKVLRIKAGKVLVQFGDQKFEVAPW